MTVFWRAEQSHTHWLTTSVAKQRAQANRISAWQSSFRARGKSTWNHRMALARGDLNDHLVPTPFPWAGLPTTEVVKLLLY